MGKKYFFQEIVVEIHLYTNLGICCSKKIGSFGEDTVKFPSNVSDCYKGKRDP
jgi:hypothetical protein